MLTKGIIEKIITKNQVQVRIPIINRAYNVAGATNTNNLSSAVICTLPGIDLNYVVGDIVIVGFEEDMFEKPVILGRLQTDDNNNSTSDIKTDSLQVNVNYSLPTEDDYNGITYHTTQKTNNKKGGGNASTAELEQQLSILEERLKQLQNDIAYPVGTVIFSVLEDGPTLGNWVQAANAFTLKFDNQNIPIYIWERIG